MSIWTIADLHLSFSTNKPMDIFGENWKGYTDKVKQNWLENVSDEDTVILTGDFSWAMQFEDAIADFKFIDSLPGRKILLKGNHDYWWQTVNSMNKILEENDLYDIYFLQNNAYLADNKIIVGTRGWTFDELEENWQKIYNRELIRLELSIKDGIEKYGNDKEIIAFMHYPPITKQMLESNRRSKYLDLLNEYNIHKLFYGHLHGVKQEEAVIGNVQGIELNLVSSDYLNFQLLKIDN